MKKIVKIFSVSAAMMMATCFFSGCGSRGKEKDARPIVSEEKVVYQGADNGSVLHNPLMGWSYYAFPWEIIRYGIPEEFDVGIILCSWDQIEKTRGEYDFDLLTRAVNRLRSDGKTVYLRLYLMPDDVWKIAGYPEWVKSVPGVGDFFQSSIHGGSYVFEHPDYLNKTYQSLVADFLAAVRNEYGDGETDVIDLRAYGLYGEWDSDWGNYWTGKYSDLDPAETAALKKQALNEFVDLYKNAFGDFTRTKIAINVPSTGFDSAKEKEEYWDTAAYRKAMDAGFAVRYDAFDNQVYDRLFINDILSEYFPASPVFGETNYGWNLERLNVEAVLSSMHTLRANITTFGFYKGNYEYALQYNGDFFVNTLRPDKNGKVIGYRILPTAIQYNKEANTGGKIHFSSQWENTGVGVLYNRYVLGLSLVDAQGKEVYFAVRNDFDVTKLILESEPYRFSTDFNLPSASELPAGTYDIRIALVDPYNNYKSAIAMPIDGNDGELNYKIGEITLR